MAPTFSRPYFSKRLVPAEPLLISFRSRKTPAEIEALAAEEAHEVFGLAPLAVGMGDGLQQLVVFRPLLRLCLESLVSHDDMERRREALHRAAVALRAHEPERTLERG